MKRFFIGMMLVLLMFVCAPKPASALTIAELQAMISQLTAQLNIMLAQQSSFGSLTETSIGTVTLVERPSLALTYDKNKQEASLVGSMTVNIQAPSGKDMRIYNVYGKLTGADGKAVYTNATKTNFEVISGANKETINYPFGGSNDVYRIKAGTTGVFRVTVKDNPAVMFAGVYKFGLKEIGIATDQTDASANFDFTGVVLPSAQSKPLTIVGERSPYITSFVSQNDKIVLYGERFGSSVKVYVDGSYKGQLKDINYAKGASTYQGSFPISWLTKSVDTSKYCYGGNVQIEDSKLGSSNRLWVTKECGVINPDPTTLNAAVNELTKANLNLSYSAPKNESSLDADQQFTITTGNSDVYIVSAGFKIDRKGDYVNAQRGLIPNGASYNLTGISNVSFKTFSDSYGNNQSGWLVKAGQKAVFKVSLKMNPQLMYSGIYTAELNSVNAFSNNSYGSPVWKGGSMPSNPVTIVGEKAVMTSSTSPTVLYPNGGEILTLAKDSILITFKPLIGKVNSVELIGSDGNVFNLGSFVGESTDKQAVNIDTAYMSKLGVKNGSYKVRVCLNLSDQYNLLCDTSDNYFTITSPVNQTSPTVLYPNGGEQVRTNEKTTIRWTGSNPSKTVRIDLNFSPIGYTYSNVQDTLSFSAPDTGSFDWIPSEFYLKAIVPGSFSVNIVRDNSSDNSDRNFSIVQGNIAPRLNITSPHGGETFTPGQIVPVSWNQSSYSTQNSLAVLKKGDDSVAKWDWLSHDNSGFKWTVPSDLPYGDYYLRITGLPSNPNSGDIRGNIGYGNSFTISSPVTQPSITILSPNGGEVFNTGGQISGSFNGVLPVGSNYEVDLVGLSSTGSYVSYDGAVFYGSTVAADRQTFSFTIPSGVIAGNMYKIRVVYGCNTSGGVCVQDLSDNYFSIASPVTPPSLPFVSIFSPSAGESLIAGKSYRIKWTNSPKIDKVTLGYSFGEGSLNWFANNSANNISNTGYYDWNVYIGNTSNNKVRLCITGYQTGVTSVSSCSDYFTVNPQSTTSTVTTPVTPIKTINPQPTTSTVTTPVTPITTTNKTCYIGLSSIGGVRWEPILCNSTEYLNAPSMLKKEVSGTSQAEKLNSIAASIQAIKELLKSL